MWSAASGAKMLHEFSVRFDCPDIEHLDMAALRAAYAAMMDAAVPVIQHHRLDLDDCILEPWAEVGCGPAGEVTTMAVQWLSERSLCVAGIRSRSRSSAPAGPVSMVGLRLRVMHTPMFDPFRMP